MYAIPPTPFTDSLALDQRSLEALVDFCLECGVHGLVTPVIASEASTLTREERFRVGELVVGRVGGRVPVVIGVSAERAADSFVLARQAAAIGASAVIAMPPPDTRDTGDDVLRFYQGLADSAAGLELWIQHFPPPVGVVISPALLARIVTSIPGVTCVKEESAQSLPMMTAVIAQSGSHLRGVFGGYGGRAMIEEFQAGATGTMPACEFADVHVRVWDLLEAGDVRAAREVHRLLLPLLVHETTFPFTWWKAVLVRRGVISTAVTRDPGAIPLDAAAWQEMDGLLLALAPHLGIPLP